MIIRADELGKFAAGIFGSEIRDGAWYGQRLPEAMRSLYTGELEEARVACPASVRLRFHTTSRSLHIALRFGRPTRPYFCSDAFVDGERFTFGPSEPTFDWAGTIFEMPEARSRLVDIFLPGMCQSGVLGLKLDDGATIEPAAPLPLRWLAYGESVTQGMTATRPGDAYVNILARELDAEVLNVGVGGATLAPELAMTVPDEKVDLVTVAYGGTDKLTGVPVSAYADRARALAWSVFQKHPKAHLAFVALPRRLDDDVPNRIGHFFRDYIEALKPLEQEFARTVVWLGDLLQPADALYLEDKAHPNDEGHERYASHLVHVLRAAMRTR